MQAKFTARKSLGQHFLRSEKAINQIVNAVGSKNLPVFEIGPGEGVLTQRLLEAGHTVIAIEIDKRSIETLEKDLRDYVASGKLKIIERDCLEVDYRKELELLPPLKGEGWGGGLDFVLVGNIPYYITGAIFRHTFEQKVLPKQAIFLVQKEVAQRVVARDGKESILSVSVKVFAKDERGAEIVDIVKAGSFAPPPKVDSAILNIKNIQNPFALVPPHYEGGARGGYDIFFQILKAAFSQKRKFMMNNLKNNLDNNIYNKYKDVLQEIFVTKYGEKIRSEDVYINDWKLLITNLN